MNSQARDVKEHFGRAKAYIAKPDAVRALLAYREGLKGLAQGLVVGRDRIELDVFAGEALRSLNRDDEVRRFAAGELVYAKGQEKQLYLDMTELARKIQAARDKFREGEVRSRKNEIDRLVLKVQQHLAARQLIEARRLIRRLIEEYADEPGLCTDVGTRMMRSGFPEEAIEFLQRAIEQNPRDARPYGGLAMIYEQTGRYDEAEALLKAAAKQFGAGPRIFLRLARLYKLTRRFPEAFDAARTAVELDPSQREAAQIEAEMRARLNL
jgi:Flp pilus assembly protein TadD